MTGCSRLLTLGADAILRKPFDNEKLLSVIERPYAEPVIKGNAGEA